MTLVVNLCDPYQGRVTSKELDRSPRGIAEVMPCLSEVGDVQYAMPQRCLTGGGYTASSVDAGTINHLLRKASCNVSGSARHSVHVHLSSEGRPARRRMCHCSRRQGQGTVSEAAMPLAARMPEFYPEGKPA